MIPAALFAVVTIVAATAAYFLGRQVGREQGSVDAYRRVAEHRRREQERR